MICIEGSTEEQASFGRIVKMAGLRGDPAGFRPAVLWIGALLKSCDLIPQPKPARTLRAPTLLPLEFPPEESFDAPILLPEDPNE